MLFIHTYQYITSLPCPEGPTLVNISARNHWLETEINDGGSQTLNLRKLL